MIQVFLDEGVPRQLAGLLRAEGLDVQAFIDLWKGLSDRALLDRVEAAGCTVLVTTDKNLVHQQRLSTRSLAVLALPTTRKLVILARADVIADTIRRLDAGEHVAITAGGQRLVTSRVEGKIVRRTMPPVDPFEL